MYSCEYDHNRSEDFQIQKLRGMQVESPQGCTGGKNTIGTKGNKSYREMPICAQVSSKNRSVGEKFFL